MKRPLGLLGLAWLGAIMSGCAATSSDRAVGVSVTSQSSVDETSGPVDFNVFYDQLAPYGHWFTYGNDGWCWSPYDTPFGWRPYSVGSWTETDAGWTWVSDEPFGWATDHYGRWVFDDDYGWVWIPGTEWAPAWVAWRQSDDWIGWAPLPPGATWQSNVGLTWNETFANQIDEDAWCFVPASAVLAPAIATRILPAARNHALLGRTELSVHFDALGGHPRNLGLDEQLVARVTGRPVPHFRLADLRRPGPARPQGRTLPMFRPQFRPNPGRAPRSVEKEQATTAQYDQQLRLQQEMDQRRLDMQYQSDRRRLEAQQRAEEQQNAQEPAIERMRQQHAAERDALDRQHERERRVIDSRYEKGMVRGNGNGRGRGVRGS